jgi:hypothetical protein
VSAVGRQSVGGGGDSGEGEIWEMGKFLKMNLNVDPRVFKLFCLKKKRKTITRGKKMEEGRTKSACVEALIKFHFPSNQFSSNKKIKIKIKTAFLR